METIHTSSIRHQLHIRKEKLDQAVKSMPDNGHLISLLQQVDTALERFDHGTYGICEVCHDAVEEDRLLADPLVTVCLGCLDDVQRRALENDLELAAKIQRNLLPKSDFKIDGWDFKYHYNPAGAVSGDFCSVIPMNDGSLVFVLGDVSGKGIGASLMMSQLHGLIHSLLTFGLPVNEIVDKANRLFCESTLYSNYATMVMGKASPDGTIEICVAGHNPPIVNRRGNLHTISATGMPVGLFCESEYRVETFTLDKGDSILLYTDGLTEAMVNNVEYGDERIKELLIKNHTPTAQQILDNLLNDHKTWLGASKPHDDVTIAVLKRM